MRLLVVILIAMIAFCANPLQAATYTYDDLGRLTSVTTSSGSSCAYTYDAGGNILTVVCQAALAVVSTDPVNQAANVPVDQTILIHFNKDIEEDINFAGITLTAGQDSVSTVNSISADTLSIDPTDNLIENTAYTLTVPAEAVKTVSGAQPNSEIMLQFTTAAAGLNMVNSDPADDESGVNIEKTITITFNQDIQAGDNYEDISLTLEGSSVSVDADIDGSILTIDPINDLLENSSYTLMIPAGAVGDASSLPNNEITIQFDTNESVVTLEMTDSMPEDDSIGVPLDQAISVTFSEAIQAGDNYTSINLSSSGLTVDASISISNDILTVIPDDDLIAGQLYTLNIPSAAIKTQTNVANSAINIQFTAMLSALEMNSTDPVDTAIDVSLDQVITITFNQDIQAGDNYSSINLCQGETPIATSNSILDGVLTINPDTDLSSGQSYAVTIPASAVENIDRTSGNLEITIQFTTV